MSFTKQTFGLLFYYPDSFDQAPIYINQLPQAGRRNEHGIHTGTNLSGTR